MRCWRCGCNGANYPYIPHALCLPCVEIVSLEEIAWVEDSTREPGKASWEMTPMGKACGTGTHRG